MSSLQPPGSAACRVQALMKQDGKCRPTELSCGKQGRSEEEDSCRLVSKPYHCRHWTVICLHTCEDIWGTVVSGQTRRGESMANGSAHHNQRNWFGEAEAGRVKWAGSVGQAVFTK